MRSYAIKFDIFQKMPKDLTEATYSGALCMCTVLLVLLGVMEVRDFLKERLTTDMLVDISHDDDRLTINMDIVFPRMPCEVLTLDV